MKKFLIVVFVWLSTMSTQFFYSTVAAQEVFVFSLNGVDHYVDTSKSGMAYNGYFAALKSYPPTAQVCITGYTFYETDHGWAFDEQTYSLGYSFTFSGMVHSDWKASAVFNVVYPQIQSAKAAIQAEARRRAEEKYRQEEAAKRLEADRQRRAEEKRRREKSEFIALIAKAEKFFGEKNYAETINAYASARGLDKTTLDKYFDELLRNGDELAAQKNFPAALDYYKKACMMYPANQKGRDKLWNIYINSKDFVDAAEFYDALTKANSVDSDAWFKLGYSRNEIKYYDSAITAYQKYIRLKPNYSNGYNNLALVYKNLKRYPEAIENFKKALSLDPSYDKANNNLWDTYVESKKFTEAIEFYSQSATYGAYLRIGYSYNMLKDYSNAIKFYQKSIKIKPSAAAYGCLADVYDEQKNYKKALEFFNKELSLAPDSATAYINLFSLYQRMKTYDKAEEIYKRAIKLNIKYAIENFDFVGLWNKNEKIIHASTDRVYFMEDLVLMYLSTKQYSKAVAMCEELLNESTDSDNYPYLCLLADSYAGLKNYDKAIEIYQKILAAVPNSSFAVVRAMISMYVTMPHASLGKIYYEMKNYDAAIEAFTTAISINPDAPFSMGIGDNPIELSCHYWRGKCHEAKGDYDAALKDYDELLKFDPKNKDAIKNRDRFLKLMKKK